MNDDRQQGFSLFQYLYNVKDTFDKAFYVNDCKPVIKHIIFAPTSDYEATAGANNPQSNRLDINIKPPAIIIDLYELKIDPSFDEYRQQRDTPHTNTGNLAIYIFVKALVLVSNNKVVQSHHHVKQLAFDIAGLVTEADGFNTRVGLSQVTHIREAELKQSDRLIGWIVQWQHSVELEPPDYSRPELRPGCYPEADAHKITNIFSNDGETAWEESEVIQDDDGNPTPPYFDEKGIDETIEGKPDGSDSQT